MSPNLVVYDLRDLIFNNCMGTNAYISQQTLMINEKEVAKIKKIRVVGEFYKTFLLIVNEEEILWVPIIPIEGGPKRGPFVEDTFPSLLSKEV